MVKNLSEGLVLDLDMNNLQDYSGNSNDGTATGTTLVVDEQNRYQRARSFNGSSDIGITSQDFEFTDGSNDEAFSGSIWYKWDGTVQKQPLFSRDDGSNRHWWFRHTPVTNTLDFLIFDGNAVYIQRYWNNETLSSDVWYYLTFTYDGSSSATGIKIYVNGERVDDTTLTAGSYVAMNTNTSQLKIGYQDYNGDANTSSLSNPKIWNRVLSTTEISQLYNNIKPLYQGLFEDCVAYYNFKGDAKDVIGGYDGTVSGATLLTTNRFNFDSGYLIDLGESISWSSVGTVNTKLAWEDTGSGWVFNTNPSYLTATGITGSSGLKVGECWLFSSVLTTAEKELIEEITKIKIIYPYGARQ